MKVVHGLKASDLATIAPGYYGKLPVPAGSYLIVCGPPSRICLVLPGNLVLPLAFADQDREVYESCIKAMGAMGFLPPTPEGK